MSRSFSRTMVAAVVGSLFVGCTPGTSATSDNNPDGSGAGGASAGGSGGTTSSAQGGGGSGASSGQFMSGTGGNQQGCSSGPNDDQDMDGFTQAEGDCNDCDPNSNPGAIEVVGDDGSGGAGGYVAADEDCDGDTDEVEPASCDDGLALASVDALEGAKSIELCKQAVGPKDWGVLSAAYVRADGTTAAPGLQAGIMNNFGPNNPPREGSNLLVLSSGHARITGQAGACGNASCTGTGVGTPPPGFPQTAPGCEIQPNINDDIGLEVSLRAPSNATGYSFDFKFHSFEYAEWVCSNFNDQFMALVDPAPAGALDGNISFDMNGAPVSVNIAFFDVCDSCANWAQNCSGSSCPPVPSPCCPAGGAELAGTGFDTWTGTFDDGNAGGTSWLRTTAPVDGGSEFSLRLAVWDTGDSALDATAVIDNFRWIASGGEVDLGTDIIPE